MQKVFSRIVLLLAVLALAYGTSWGFGYVFSHLVFEIVSDISALHSLIGIGLSYIFWVALLGGFLRTRLDMILMVLLLLPALWWEMQLDASRIYIPIALGVLGFVAGYFLKMVAEKILRRHIHI